MEKSERGQNAQFTIDLPRQVIVDPDGTEIPFEVDSFRKHCLLNGLDDIALTLQKGAAIDGYEDDRSRTAPWTTPAAAE